MYKRQVNKEITPYNFSDSLLQATKGCSPYTEDVAEKNPQMASLAELFGGNEWKILIDIKGFNQDKLCHFTVSQNAGEITFSEYDCLASAEQMAELHKAMLDRSSQPVTETFTTYAEISDGNGNFQKSPIEMTMTDSLLISLGQKSETQLAQSNVKNRMKKAKRTFSTIITNFRILL